MLIKLVSSAPVLSTSDCKLPGRKLVRANSAESIYRCMLLFLDHILYHRAHFVRGVLCTSRAVLAINHLPSEQLSYQKCSIGPQNSAEKIIDAGSAFQSVMVSGKKMYLYNMAVLAYGTWNAIGYWFLLLLFGSWRSSQGVLTLLFRPLNCNITTFASLVKRTPS